MLRGQTSTWSFSQHHIINRITLFSHVAPGKLPRGHPSGLPIRKSGGPPTMRMPACSENEVNDKDTDDNNNNYNNNKLPPSDINSSKFPPETLGGFDENATGLEQVGKIASPGLSYILCNSAHLYIHVYQNRGGFLYPRPKSRGTIIIRQHLFHLPDVPSNGRLKLAELPLVQRYIVT